MDDFDFICNEVIDFGVLVCKKGTYADMDEFMAAAKSAGGVTVADVGANSNKHANTKSGANGNKHADAKSGANGNKYADTVANRNSKSDTYLIPL